MSTDKTLADAQPGGRVRLGDRLPPLPKMQHIGRVVGMGPHDTWYEPVAYTSEQMRDYARAALSAQSSPATCKEGLQVQPSPGGQGGDSDLLAELRDVEDYFEDVDPNPIHLATVRAAIDALAARQPVVEPAYNSDGISLTACQLHEALLMAGDPELDVPFEDRSLVRIFWTETGHSGPGLYCECVDAEEEGCILLDGTAPAIGQSAQAVDPSDPWRGLYSPDLMPKLDGTNQYHVAHPDLPEWPKAEDEERGIGPLITAQGFAMAVVFGEYPDEETEEVDYCAWLASWTPDTPDGIGWRLVCIQDSEDGPAAFFVRPLALIDSQAVGNGR
ncbi:TPA: hypothetical protein ACXNG6_000215 [Stenotrophomonas maltophilia]